MASKPTGYITLISLIVVGAVATAVTLSLILLGLSSARSSLSNQQGGSAYFLAEACVEEALREIRENSSYAGNDSLNFSVGSCQYTVSNQGGEQRLIQSTGTVGVNTRRIEAQTQSINPQIFINYWQEVTNF